MSQFHRGLLSTLFLILESVLNKAVGLVSTLILARVLVPEDFGLVATALLIVGFFEILTDTGGSSYLLRLENLNESEINTAWTINLILKTSIALLIFFGSYFTHLINIDERVALILQALSLILIIQSFKNPAIVHLKRRQEYGPLVKVNIVAKVFAVCVTLFVALVYKSYWALVIGHSISNTVPVIGSYLVYPYQPKFHLANAKAQWRFSIWIIPQAVLGYLRTQLDTLLVSMNFSKAQLGSFHTMKYIAFIPSINFLMPLTETFLVELRRASTEYKNFLDAFNATLLVALVIAIPIATFMFSEHTDIVFILLGENWISYSYLLAFFSILIPLTAINRHCNKTLVVFNKPKNIFVYEVLSFIFIYTNLLMIGIDELEMFTKTRVGLEALCSLLLLGYVSLKYTDIKNTIKVFCNVLILTTISLTSLTLMSSVNVENYNVFARIIVRGASFTVTFIILTISAYIFFLRYFAEWKYLYKLTLKAIDPIIQKKAEK